MGLQDAVSSRLSVGRGMLLDMAGTDPAPVTLVVGDEELLAERAVAAVVTAARAGGAGAEVHDLVGSKVTTGELTQLTSPSLFGDQIVVVIRSAQDLVKDVIAEVVAYAKRPSDDVVLVLAHPGGVKGKALVDGVKKAGAKVVTISKVTKAGDRLDFVKSEVKRAGRNIAPDAAQALLDAVGNDLRELAAACGQLAFDTQDKTINLNRRWPAITRGGPRSPGSTWRTRRSRGGWGRRWSSCGGRSAPGSPPSCW